MSRRNIELVLLLVAAPVVALLFAMIAINEGQHAASACHAYLSAL